jgi:WhiB family redox-sensing transcriptional regulator
MPLSLFFPKNRSLEFDGSFICTTCQVADECLQYSIDNQVEFGIWGGMRERQRAEMLEKRFPQMTRK